MSFCKERLLQRAVFTRHHSRLLMKLKERKQAKQIKDAFCFFFAVQSRNHMFITFLIGQAVLIILLICALVHWIRKRNQQNSSHSPLDRLDSCKTSDGKCTHDNFL